MNTRVNSFAGLADFDVKPRHRKPVDPAQIDQVAIATGFPSRPIAPVTAPPATSPAAASPVPPASAATPAAPETAGSRQRRYTTGRNQQLGLKVTKTAGDLLRRLADLHNLPMGEVVYRALLEFERNNPK
jgi:hypothetical protein